VTIVATGGTAPYSYTFNSTTNTTGVFYRRICRNWTIINRCERVVPVTGTVDVNQPPVLALTSAAVTTTINCNGGKPQ
jgi:uncharacterized protein affecting Mg2+/Co2+ transport